MIFPFLPIITIIALGGYLFSYGSFMRYYLESAKKGIKKQDSMENFRIGSATIAKMGKGEIVTHIVINKTCRYIGEEVEILIRYGAKTKVVEQ